MAAIDNSADSLLGLEAELTCSICLSTFDCPVTIPCGHNFCRSCLEATWESSTTCPQCRTYFPIRPELKKNTVLSTVVETLSLRSSGGDGGELEEKRVDEKRVLRCDACMEAEAAQTCLTCMASYCEEHLRPHRENPIFRPHQLSEPLDLSERICSEHHKLMELYCVQHGRSICSLCLQQAHKGCAFHSPEEQRRLKESDLRNKLDLLNGKILTNENVICQMKDVHDKLEESANNRKKVLVAEYQQMRDMLNQEESLALNALDREVQSGQGKLRDLMKKFTVNIDNMSTAKEEIHSLLSQSQSLAFLQVSVNLPQAVNFDPYTPRITLDSKKVLANQAFSAALKEHLTEIFQQPLEARLQVIKAEPFSSQESKNPSSQPKAGQKKHEEKKKQTKKPSQSKGDFLTELYSSMENLLDLDKKGKANPWWPAQQPNQKPETSYIPQNVTSAEKRNDLLKYGTVLTFDPKTAHKRITLSEGFTKASVSEEHANYPNHPARFAVCSQVLASSGFSKGRHYWEVRLSSNSFVGIGLANRSIDRKGPTSRLGRNAQSWCVEWFHVKLSAWHNSVETVLGELNPKRVGVLLDCDRGVVIFYNVADRAYPFHSFELPCLEVMYPAFWMFSNGSSISLCKLQA